MSNIVVGQVEQYIRGLVPERAGLLKQIEEEARAEEIPIIQPEVGQLLLCLARLRGARRVLEVGAATGYSALWLAQGLGEEGTLTTIELDPARARKARENFEQWFGGSAGPVTLLEGDALQILPSLKGPFDMIFVDAAKGQYPEFLRQVERLLAPGGVLVADNVLFRGMVARPEEDVERRYRTLVRRLREFLERLTGHPDWDTSVLPIGDGVALSYKRN